MSLWNKITKPVNDVLDSKAFKAVMPVQAIGQEAVKFGTKAAGINAGHGLNPADQYATGAAIGSVLGAGSALSSGSGAGSPGASSPNASSAWENHAPINRHTSDDSDNIASYYHKKYPMPEYPTLRETI